MNRRLIVIGLTGFVALATATGVFAARSLATAPPIQGSPLKVVLSADTVTGGGNPAPASTCAQTNFFKRGQLVVFRVWGVNVAAGGTAITDADVKYARVKIPGIKAIPLQYAAEPPNSAHQHSYWHAVWIPGKKYPLGVV